MARDKEARNRYMAEYMLKRYHERRIAGIQHLGGKCVGCGTQDDLEFHHINPEEKEFSLGSVTSLSLERFIDEVNKCQLLCGPCHKLFHAAVNEHGTPQKYWNGCRCDTCKSGYNDYMKEYKNNKLGT